MANEFHGESDASRAAGRTLTALAGLAVAGLIFSWVVSGPAPRKHPEREAVHFWHMWPGKWKKVVENICDKFNESQPRYEVIPLSIPGRAADSKFLLAVAGGDPPDCMAQWNQVIPKWAESKLIVPLNEMMTGEQWRDFQQTAYPVAQQVGMYKGNLYGVTIGLNLWACYYREQHLLDANLDPDRLPETLEELVAWGEKLHRFNETGQLTRIGLLPQHWIQFAPIFAGGFWDAENARLTIATPENLRTLRFLADYRGKLGFENVVKFESSLSGQIGDAWPFMEGAYSITIDGQWRVQDLSDFNEKARELAAKTGKPAKVVNYRTAPVPPPKGGRERAGWANGNFMIIPAGARNPAGAWAFIKFWSGLEDPEQAALFYTWGGWLPINERVAKAKIYQAYIEKHPQFRTFVDMMSSPNIQPTPPVPFQVLLGDRIKAADESAMRGTLTPEEAVERLVREIDAEKQRRREVGYVD